MSPSDSFCDIGFSHQLLVAAKILRQGGVVAFPTESSYGFAVDVCNEEALRRLYQLKKRPGDKALPVIVSEKGQLAELTAEIPPQYEVLIQKFWPGALTLVFPANSGVNSILTGGGQSIAIRQSAHPIASGLAAAFGSAITATSANRSGELPCTSACEIEESFGGAVDMVINGGKADAVPSTIVALRGGELLVLREGELAPLLNFPKKMS